MSEVSTDKIDSSGGIDETVFVAYIGSDDNAARETFSEVAKKYREEFSFGIVSDAALLEEHASVLPTVTCHLKDGGTITRTTTSFTDSAALEKFVIKASRPVVGELTQWNQQRLVNVSAISSARRRKASSLSEKLGLTKACAPAWMAHGLPLCKDRR